MAITNLGYNNEKKKKIYNAHIVTNHELEADISELADNPINVEILRLDNIITTYEPNHVVDFPADTYTTAL